MIDPTPAIKDLFGDLVMQIALLQTQLDLCKQEMEELKQSVKEAIPLSKNPDSGPQGPL